MKELKFTDEIIINSYEIQSWLTQFNPEDIEIIISILKQLSIIDIVEFRDFLKQKLLKLIDEISKDEESIAVYPIRKLDRNYPLWVPDKTEIARICDRSPQGNGSEDLITVTIDDLCKSESNYLIQSPNIKKLKDNKIKNIVFVVDNSISGSQVIKYIKNFFENKTLISYWNLNYLKVTILSLYLSDEAKNRIESDSFFSRKLKKNRDAISFEYVLRDRPWEDREKILRTIEKYKKIQKKYRFGFNNSASNIIFEHSVPNNIFGIFFCSDKNWKPLFPGRRIPISLLHKLRCNYSSPVSEIPESHLKILNILKSRSKSLRTIARKIGYSERETKLMCDWLTKIRFIELNNNFYKLIGYGKDFLKGKESKLRSIDKFNFEIYTPAAHVENNFTFSSKHFNDFII